MQRDLHIQRGCFGGLFCLQYTLQFLSPTARDIAVEYHQMGHIMWNALKGQGGAQGCDFGTNLVMGTSGSELTIAAASIKDMLIFCLDTSVTNEGRSPGSDKFVKARNALGGAKGATLSGHTAAITASRGVVLTHTASGNTFDVGNAHAFAVAIASLCQPAIPDAAGQLARMAT